MDSLQAGSVLIKLDGTAAKEGQDRVGKAMGLMFVPFVPVGIFVHGKDAEIKQGASFTAFVDADALISLRISADGRSASLESYARPTLARSRPARCS